MTMQPFSEHTGLVAPLDRVNVDTDQIIPKQFGKLLTKEGFGKYLFYDWRYLEGEVPNPAFELNEPRFQGASILLARANFGCGSSREHAAWAVRDYGFRVVIAPSFADIFYNNCFKNGILPVTLPDPQIDQLFERAQSERGCTLTVDLDRQTISDGNNGNFPFTIDAYRKESLLKGLDEIGLTLEHEAKIAAYEKKARPQVTLYDADAVDVLTPNQSK